MRDNRKRDLKIGAFFLAGVVAVLVVLEFAGSLPFLSDYRQLGIYFDSAPGLERGAFVKMEGVRVGNVTNIGFSEDGSKIKVSARVQKDIPLTENTEATIRLGSLLGTGYINLSLDSSGGEPLPPDAALQGSSPHDFDKIIQSAGKFLSSASDAAARLDSILTKVDEGRGSIGKLVNDEDLYDAAKDTIIKANTSLDTIEDLAPVSFIATVIGVAGTFY